MSLLLIRHGETDFNATRVVQFPDTPLGQNGLAQAERLGARLAARPLGLVVTSDYARARMTAERIAAQAGIDLVENPLLRERNFGELRGTPYDQLGDIDPFALGYVPPGGESWEVFHARVDQAWAALQALSDGVEGEIAIVTHGLVLRSLLERILDASAHVVTPDLIVGNTSVTTVERVPPWRVVELACVAHLDGGANDVAPV
ncbi:MAG: histidine phosphatase family protein [Gammaproteobacteria bacterium]|nr:histidine phosphatase family protein [Gammaproteobacteria bacterium]MCP5202243.1 histidine phosphatase family protein [Gammaproteobacteria bacterium]